MREAADADPVPDSVADPDPDPVADPDPDPDPDAVPVTDPDAVPVPAPVADPDPDPVPDPDAHPDPVLAPRFPDELCPSLTRSPSGSTRSSGCAAGAEAHMRESRATNARRSSEAAGPASLGMGRIRG